MCVLVAVAVVVVVVLMNPPKQYQPVVSEYTSCMKARVADAIGSVRAFRAGLNSVGSNAVANTDDLNATEYVLCKTDTCPHCATMESQMKKLGMNFKTVSPYAGIVNVEYVPVLFKFGKELEGGDVKRIMSSTSTDGEGDGDDDGDDDEGMY